MEAASVTGTGRNDMERRSERASGAMRRMTGKQKKPIISGNLGAAARDPRNREREREGEGERETSSRDRTNERPAEASFYNDAMRRIARAVRRGHRRQQPCDYPSANILAARTPRLVLLRSTLRSFRRATPSRPRARLRSRPIITITNTPLDQGCPATNHTSS